MDTKALETLALNLRRRARDESRSILVSMALDRFADAIDETISGLHREELASETAEAELCASYGGTE